jgi:hypothetical protein
LPTKRLARNHRCFYSPIILCLFKHYQGNSSTQDLTAAVTWVSSDITKVTISYAAGSNGKATAIPATDLLEHSDNLLCDCSVDRDKFEKPVPEDGIHLFQPKIRRNREHE